MSDPVRMATVTIKARVRFTGDMLEDRMLDAVIDTVKMPDVDPHVEGDNLEIMSVKYLCIVDREEEVL